MTGRPRNPDIDAAILKATFELVREAGYRGLSIEGIAARCGITKQAIYRRYRGKGEVILDVLSRFAREQLPKPDTGSLAGDLTELLRATFVAQSGESGALNRALVIEALQDERFAGKLWSELINVRREGVQEMLDRARARGEITRGTDQMLIDLVYGPMWYWLLFDPKLLGEDYADQIVATVLTVAGVGTADSAADGQGSAGRQRKSGAASSRASAGKTAAARKSGHR